MPTDKIPCSVLAFSSSASWPNLSHTIQIFRTVFGSILGTCSSVSVHFSAHCVCFLVFNSVGIHLLIFHMGSSGWSHLRPWGLRGSVVTEWVTSHLRMKGQRPKVFVVYPWVGCDGLQFRSTHFLLLWLLLASVYLYLYVSVTKPEPLKHLTQIRTLGSVFPLMARSWSMDSTPELQTQSLGLCARNWAVFFSFCLLGITSYLGIEGIRLILISVWGD